VCDEAGFCQSICVDDVHVLLDNSDKISIFATAAGRFLRPLDVTAAWMPATIEGDRNRSLTILRLHVLGSRRCRCVTQGTVAELPRCDNNHTKIDLSNSSAFGQLRGQ